MKPSLWDLKPIFKIFMKISEIQSWSHPYGIWNKVWEIQCIWHLESWSHPYGIWNRSLSSFSLLGEVSWSHPYGIWNWKIEWQLSLSARSWSHPYGIWNNLLQINSLCWNLSWSHPYGIWNLRGRRRTWEQYQSWSHPYGIWNPQEGAMSKMLAHHEAIPMGFETRVWSTRRCNTGNHEAIPMGFETKVPGNLRRRGQSIMKPSLWDLKPFFTFSYIFSPKSWSHPYGIWNYSRIGLYMRLSMIMKPSLWDLKHS